VNELNARIERVIGSMTIQILQLQHQLELSDKSRVSSYELLFACIASGQVAREDIDKLIQSDEVFGKWYERKLEKDSQRNLAKANNARHE